LLVVIGEEGERLEAGGCETEGFQPFFCFFIIKMPIVDMN